MNDHTFDLINKFNDHFNISSDNYRIYVLNLKADTQLDPFIESDIRNLLDNTHLNQKAKSGEGYGFCFYGIQAGLISMQNKFEFITMGQNGYTESSINHSGENEELELVLKGNPAYKRVDNLQLYKRLLGKLTNRLFKNLNIKKLNIFLPPVPDDFVFPDFKEILESRGKNGQSIQLSNFGNLLQPEPGVIQYIVMNCEVDTGNSFVISGYETVKNQINHIGSIGFYKDRSWLMKELQPKLIECRQPVQNQRNKEVKKVKKIQQNTVFSKPECKYYGLNFDFNEFLNSHSTDIYDRQYSVSKLRPVHFDDFEISIETLVRKCETLNSADASILLTGKESLYEVSLFDHSLIASEIEQCKSFSKSGIETSNENICNPSLFSSDFTVKHYLGLPANFYRSTFRLKPGVKAKLDYSKLIWDKDLSMDIILSIISHNDFCTIEDIAEDLIWLYNAQADPSAQLSYNYSLRFSCDLFLKLFNTDQVEVRIPEDKHILAVRLDHSQNNETEKEIIQRFNEQKSKLKVKNSSSITRKQTVKRPQSHKPTGLVRSDPWDIPIKDLNVKQRTKNILKRSGINNCIQLKAYTPNKLRHIKNLGKDSILEIRAELARRGLSLQPDYRY